ncbi:hypothetical protein, variant [Aphanomyces invadans]|uniref:Palmitoyltransferase n=1 Tax=Aphanomyces invadans TaxID=157072 RepID=A0A024U3U1_9STRA|nr:hypothetical protein, variant [Aphanomyces invadans]ETW00567.1 hypothetical protein, variant [Aphanomyces invadans]|eukprot:XP_008870702.1 hypothetical protein, variant [Aphanomyces invadans]
MASDRKKHGNECGTSFRAKVWCNWDACGIVCAVISWFLVLYAEYVVVGVVIYPWMGLGFFGLLHICLFTTVCFLALVSHGKDAIPVALKHATKEEINRLEEQRFRTCRRCKIFKPARAHHCSICERCVIKMDHHCPWVNNCVGLGNHKFFLLFIFYVFVLAIYALSLVFTRYAHCIDDTCASNGLMHVVCLCMEAVLFGLFTMCMMCDQYSVITTGTTQIDRLKGETSENLGVREVFGGSSSKPSLHWLLPVNISFPESIKEQLLGYALEELEVHCSNDTLSTEMDVFLPAGESVRTEKLQGGWSVEKHVLPKEDIHVV